MNENIPYDLKSIARQAMLSRGFRVDFPADVLHETASAHEPSFEGRGIRDLSGWLWSSIDNDDSRDLDQIEYVQEANGAVSVFVAIADVGALVPQGSATDMAAQQNTTSVYTGVETFPMLPERLSTDLSSLNEGQQRLAVVIEMSVGEAGLVTGSSVFAAVVQNQAQLSYSAVCAWLEQRTDGSALTQRLLSKIAQNPDLQRQLALQDRIAQCLRKQRHAAGALDFQRLEVRPTLTAGGNLELSSAESNRASQLIEELMVAANESIDAFLQSRKYPSVQRVVRTPKNWPRMVQLAAEHGAQLPTSADGPALQNFLSAQRLKDPDHFPDLSLAMVKLMGRGEYVLKTAERASIGHFGLAAANYAHSTAPNRRYPDLLTQRLLQAAFRAQPPPYSVPELDALARHCSEKEDDASRVERQVHKCIAAAALRSRIGERFAGIITGSSDEGVWIRVRNPPVEGKVQGQGPRPAVGQAMAVRLTHVDPIRGYIDFEACSD